MSSIRRTRVGLACSRCRARKVKCVRDDQTSPAPCKRCNKRGFDCKYVGVGEESPQLPAKAEPRIEETPPSSPVDGQRFLEAFNNYARYLGLVLPTQPQHTTSPLFSSPCLPNGHEEESRRTIFTRDDLLVHGSSRAYLTHNQISTGYPYLKDPDREFTMSAYHSSIYPTSIRALFSRLPVDTMPVDHEPLEINSLHSVVLGTAKIHLWLSGNCQTNVLELSSILGLWRRLGSVLTALNWRSKTTDFPKEQWHATCSAVTPVWRCFVTLGAKS
ncbi:hypothetical protein B0H16DRAFT_1686236 [Mycena metata]|uniref:Zn(2)-C6 fungal-type domain-containing protein n=1 Tax=Mycena metata TaxID=1033252 RepID=A0AAD7NPX8_9AGAR|nr:hypothetical protein B0H16DRAFT_1686236 [Mycena metata]